MTTVELNADELIRDINKVGEDVKGLYTELLGSVDDMRLERDTKDALRIVYRTMVRGTNQVLDAVEAKRADPALLMGIQYALIRELMLGQRILADLIQDDVRWAAAHRPHLVC